MVNQSIHISYKLLLLFNLTPIQKLGADILISYGTSCYKQIHIHVVCARAVDVRQEVFIVSTLLHNPAFIITDTISAKKLISHVCRMDKIMKDTNIYMVCCQANSI